VRSRRFTVEVAASQAGRQTRPVELLPNLITLCALACGLTTIRFALVGEYNVVIMLIIVAAILDATDGRVARALGAESTMGEQMDSLCDAIGFGVSPAIVSYTLIADDHGRMWALAWFAALVYASAIVLRLARFNTDLEDEERPDYMKEFFIGVPAPAASWLALAPVMCRQAFGEGFWTHPVFMAWWLIFIAALAFSRIPTFSFKKLDMKNARLQVGLLFSSLMVIAGLFTVPYLVILTVLIVYIGTIPFSILIYTKHKSHASLPGGYAAARAEGKALRQRAARRRRAAFRVR
jgi:CDP-diacylglycerol--serine O-phosphatidyltransferase